MDRPPGIGERTALGRAYLAGELAQAQLRGDFRPSRRDDVAEIDALSSAQQRAAAAIALEILDRGAVAYGVLAAGASTRMSLGEMPAAARRLLERSKRGEIRSKALVPVVEVDGRVLSFLDLFLENVARLSHETRTSCPVLVLASESNGDEIDAAFSRAPGVSPADVVTFRQALDRQIVATPADLERARGNFGSERDVAAALEVSREFAGCELAVTRPGGHGEFLHQLISSGALCRLLRRGVRWISVRNIDNVAGLLDHRWLAILGRLIEARRNFVVEVSRRPDGPAGKGGALIVRPSGELQVAEDPAFAGTGIDPRASYYINDATAILGIEYLFRIYETSADELLSASAAVLREIAERGRRKFPALIDVKPVRLASGSIVGAFARETNLWESTGAAPRLGVDAAGVSSVKDVEEGFDEASPEEQKQRALRVRFAASKKWEDYEGVNSRLVPHLARRVLEGPLLAAP